ncbi:hypothetical protein [Pseudanabaena sp. 'Roaring Creek']|uniref:hypothetical protein n=1 Tax=Pseudanabaena sp. 'Roaring Creek' TaxID=1681830 RepID=UPI0006D7CFE9|nr:hypothetical protein [Pseudanabaena sp. 'Roaring Creek']
MQIEQLELNLWEAIATAAQVPEEANLPKVFDLLDLTLLDLDTRSQLRVAGEAVIQIADLFRDRTNSLFEELQAQSTNEGPIMTDDAFDRYIRQSAIVDLDQFISPLSSLPRKSPERAKDGNSIVRPVDKQTLIQLLEQEDALAPERQIELVMGTAHAENVSDWIEAIANCLNHYELPILLPDLVSVLPLPIVEIWLGLLLGSFHLVQKGSFYDSQQLWIDRS